VGILAQAQKVSTETEEGEEIVTHNPVYALEDSGIGHTKQEALLFKPEAQFIKKLFDYARKPRAYVPYVKGLMNFASGHSEFPKMLFKTIELGLNEEDYKSIRQFLVLFENILCATTCEWH
jgi:hypothetical protein